MMKINQLNYSALRLTLLFICLSILSSCTFEKRRYNSGYHIERKNNKNENYSTSNKEEVSNDECSESSIGLMNNIQEKTINFSNDTTESTAKKLEIINENASSENKPIFSSKELLSKNKTRPIFNSANHFLEEKAILVNKNTSSVSSSKSDNPGSLLLPLGFGFLLGGFLVFWFISILIGILFMFLGLLFIIIGAIIKGTSSDKTEKKTEKKEENNKNGQYVDVVYIKNGSIIRGIIIEQIPNVQIKIKTKDGSVFVYKMDEIERITKEQE